MGNTDIWKEGKYLDLWSVNHFLSGIVATGWFLVFGVTLKISFVLYLILAVGWEIYEVIRGIHEHAGNKVMDVVTGVVGFFFVYYLVSFGRPLGYCGLLAVTLIYLLMEVWGYAAYNRKK